MLSHPSNVRRARRIALAAAVALLAGPFAAEGAGAAGNANAVKGLVADHCSSCHEVPGIPDSGLPTLDAPPFATIAEDRATYPDARIRRFLQEPHWPMEQFSLSPSDIENLIAYFDSLRAK